MRFGPMEILLILLLVGAVVGTKNLPKLGKKAGEAVKELKDNSSEITDAVKAVNNEVKELKDAVTLDLKAEDVK